MKVCFETFGCRLNRAEALEEEAKYLTQGWERTESHSDADLIVVRGCSVTARAQRDCEKLIAHLKRKYPTTRLVVQGCLKTRRVLSPGIPVQSEPQPEPAAEIAYDPSVPLPTRTARAYLKVQDGCAGQCTFCIVPSFRGPSVSLGYGNALDKARRFIAAGYREIVVTGCNLSLYASEGKRLPELLDGLTALDPSVRIRLGSLEPGACADSVVQLMAERTNFCRMLHLPIQSASNLVLSAMRRPYLLHDVETLIGRAVELMPDLGLGCDLMTGFPGETEVDFMATKGLLKRHPFSNAHIFPYSTRPGTLAAALPGKVPHEIRSRRAHDLADIVRGMRQKFARKFIGQTVEIIVEDEQKIAGWIPEYLWCESTVPAARIKGCTVKRKDRLRLLVHDVHRGILRGRVV